MDYRNVFGLEENERGETDLIQFETNTGDSPSKSNPSPEVHTTCSSSGDHSVAEENARN